MKKFIVVPPAPLPESKKEPKHSEVFKKANEYKTLEGKTLLTFDPLRDGVTQSLITTWRTCQKKARLSISGIFKENDEGYALIFGTVFHEYLDLVYSSLISRDLEKFSDLEEHIKACTRFVENKFSLKMEKPGKVSDNYKLAILICEKIVFEYFKYWRADFFGETKKSWVALEEEFKIPHPEKGYLVRGKMDGVFRDSSDGLWLFETKTKGQFSESYLGQMIERDLQVNLYMLALLLKYGEEPKGVLYNIIRRPALRQGKAENVEEFAERCIADVRKDPSKYFVRMEVRVPEKVKYSFRQRLLEVELPQFVKWLEQDPDHDIEATHNCVGPCGPCKYLGYCSGNMEGYSVKESIHSELSQKETEE